MSPPVLSNWTANLSNFLFFKIKTKMKEKRKEKNQIFFFPIFLWRVESQGLRGLCQRRRQPSSWFWMSRLHMSSVVQLSWYRVWSFVITVIPIWDRKTGLVSGFQDWKFPGTLTQTWQQAQMTQINSNPLKFFASPCPEWPCHSVYFPVFLTDFFEGKH